MKGEMLIFIGINKIMLDDILHSQPMDEYEYPYINR